MRPVQEDMQNLSMLTQLAVKAIAAVASYRGHCVDVVVAQHKAQMLRRLEDEACTWADVAETACEKVRGGV